MKWIFLFSGYPGFEDPVSYWWSCVIAIAAYWLLGDGIQAERLYEIVEKVPVSVNGDMLVCTVLSCYACRKKYNEFSDEKTDKNLILKMCNTAGKYLQESIALTECLPQDNRILVSLE